MGFRGPQVQILSPRPSLLVPSHDAAKASRLEPGHREAIDLSPGREIADLVVDLARDIEGDDEVPNRDIRPVEFASQYGRHQEIVDLVFFWDKPELGRKS